MSRWVRDVDAENVKKLLELGEGCGCLLVITLLVVYTCGIYMAFGVYTWHLMIPF